MPSEPNTPADDQPMDATLRPRRFTPPSELAELERRRQRLFLLAIRMLFLVLLVTVSLLPFVGALSETPDEFSFWDYAVPFFITFGLGVTVVFIDTSIPNKRLSSVLGIYFGLIAGLIGALAIGWLLDLVARSWDLSRDKTWVAYLGLAKFAIGITLCYLAVSIVVTTKDDFRLVIPYVEFAKQIRGVRPLLIDTSILVDGRVDSLGQTGFLDAPLIVPQFVLEELQALADSSDKLKRARGRRGLGVVTKLQANPFVDVSIDTTNIPKKSVDHMLLDLAQQQGLRILTTDYNLNKVAEIQGVTVLNLNDLANTLKSQAIPGEMLVVEVVKHGEGQSQGVGYMPDGTMVVIEEAAAHVGKTVSLVVTNSLQTAAGRMIFGTMKDVSNGEELSHANAMAKHATSQPKVPVKTGSPVTAEPDARRNPRR